MSNLALSLSNNARAFLDDLQPKQFKQVTSRIFALQRDPYPADYKHLKNHPGVYRIDQGEFRICYQVNSTLVQIVVAGPRNDDAVYRQLDRVMG